MSGKQPIPSTSQAAADPKKDVTMSQADYAKDIASQMVIAAEKFRADVCQPQGKTKDKFGDNHELEQLIYETTRNYFAGVEKPKDVEQIIEDDEFFHITCHVEKGLAAKIERGEYVDLEKLLRDWFRRKSEEERLEFVNKEGHTFLAPANDHDPKINGIRRWEQAFRVYAAIYSKANPQRASEIWQYIHTINTAASNFIWENVAYYDFTFRQMMSQNPRRSWAKIYGQLWNLAMCTPSQRNITNQQGGHSQGRGNQLNGGGGGNGKFQRRDQRPCWKFNKNQSCFDCDFEHKCLYCGSRGHSVLDCPKLYGKKNSDGRKG